MGLNSISPATSVVVFESHPENPPVELIGFKREIDPLVSIPTHLE
jgi:hypothetical protein